VKIFCIGFHKTATSSLGHALKYLGYKVKGSSNVENDHIAEEISLIIDKWVPKFDAFQDNPWPMAYKELDQKFPGNKFILTIRDTDKWLNSAVRHFGTKETAMRRWIYGAAYGCPAGNEEIYRKRFDRHNREVQEYFEDRPNDLLVMDITKGDGWEKLCPFLGKELPDIPFPQSNTAEIRASRRPESRFSLKKMEKNLRKHRDQIKRKIKRNR